MDASQLTPQQRQAVLMRAQQEANQQIMQDMIQRMVKTCFNKCAGTSVRFVIQQFELIVQLIVLNSFLLCTVLFRATD